ncbi:MAG: hypothetical protein WBA35_10060, partial [Litorimonas sp.]
MTDFASLLQTALGQPVADLTRLTAGASMESWAFTSDGEALILRRTPGGVEAHTGLGGISMATEAALIQAAGAHGVTAPEVRQVFGPGSPVGTAYV